ncbi:cytidylyltransferase domain-containing protein [Metabacillus iocasae]|uniref:CMP-N-acetylneuraminic acid synthetase n=1 Tax=Priestia iocasae TaxID=2291674 RepID=A0ABS2QU53_9BACI|nr:acylneuraminate cytidylyltransferase family protein [Metabacillus iocasae]MBM7703018.1 CMP-N-acetylneuraminic acid synthetase [Metabacillus iocasae]
MYKGKKIIALIPARGGSKGIPYKNIKLLGGKPLIAWTIEVAKSIPEIDQVVVSTDDLNIAIVSQYYGAEVVTRPEAISGDYAMSIDVVRHVLGACKEQDEHYDVMLYLEPTSPLRTTDDIYNCLDLLLDQDNSHTSVATFSEAELNPVRAWRVEGTKPYTFIENANPFLPRQQLPKAYQLNGAVYAFYVDVVTPTSKVFLNQHTGAVIIPKDRTIDIDDEKDFLLAELLIERRQHHEK